MGSSVRLFSAAGYPRIDGSYEAGELPTEDLAVRKDIFESRYDQSATLECFEFIVDFVAGAARLAKVLRKLRIAAEPAALGDVFVNRVGGAAELVGRVRPDLRTEIAHETIDSVRQFAREKPTSSL